MLPALEAILYLLMRIQEQIDRDPVAGQLPAQIPCFLKPRVKCQPAIRHCYQQVKIGIGPFPAVKLNGVSEGDAKPAS